MSGEVTQAELLPCPNPWCHQTTTFGPIFIWKETEAALVECQSCGLQGPIFSPIVRNDDGEQIGTRDAEAEAIAAWNTRLSRPEGELAELIGRLRDGAGRFLKWTYKENYSGPPVISIPRHPGNIDALLCQAADALSAAEAQTGWQPIETAPSAMHVLAARFDASFGEWVYGAVMSPPSKPFTHWQPLPDPPATAIRSSEG